MQQVKDPGELHQCTGYMANLHLQLPTRDQRRNEKQHEEEKGFTVTKLEACCSSCSVSNILLERISITKVQNRFC